MAELIQVFTIVRKLFLPDVVPWPSLLTESNLEKLRVRYRFTELMDQSNNPVGGAGPQIFAQKGEFLINGLPVLVEQFIVQPVVLQFQIACRSDLADEFVADLGRFFLEIDPNKTYDKTRELATTYQTIAIAKLSASFDTMFSERFSKFLAETLKPRVAPPDTSVDIRLQNVRWVVTYKPQTADYTFLPKALAIEPRQGSRPEEMTYFTQSPTDFETHMALLSSLEQALA